MNKNPKDLKLDEYEEDILQAFEQGKLEPNESDTDFQTIARNTLKKTGK